MTCPETVHQRPCVTKEIETWLSDSRVSHNCVVDHRSRRPVLSSLVNCVNRCQVWPYSASRCMPRRRMLKDISIHRPLWWTSMILSTCRRELTCLLTYLHCQLPLCDVEEVQHGWALAAMRAAWVADSLKSGTLHNEVECIDEICVAGSSSHWTAVFCDWVA